MKGILFNDKYGLTDAVLSGRKTQTRRIIKCPSRISGKDVYSFYVAKNNQGEFIEVCCVDFDEAPIEGGCLLPKYKLGEIVAIKQSYETIDNAFPHAMIYTGLYEELKLDKSNGVAPLNLAGWTNKMFVKNDIMPYRIKITNIRVERLQDISDNDCLAEGLEERGIGTILKYTHQSDLGKHYYTSFDSPKQAFASLINKVSGKGTWESNPFVFVYDFELINQLKQQSDEK